MLLIDSPRFHTLSFSIMDEHNFYELDCVLYVAMNDPSRAHQVLRMQELFRAIVQFQRGIIQPFAPICRQWASYVAYLQPRFLVHTFNLQDHHERQLFQHLYTLRPHMFAPGVMDLLCRYGDLALIHYLHLHGASCTKDAMDWAASAGHLDVVKYLHRNRREGCTTDAMDLAAKHGHLHVVEFLDRHRHEGATTKAMDEAAVHGHLHVVQYLHYNRREGCTKYGMDRAALEGHLEILQFLHSHRYEGCTVNAINWAAQHGHLDIVRFLHTHRKEGYTANALKWAAQNNHIDVVHFLLARKDKIQKHFVEAFKERPTYLYSCLHQSKRTNKSGTKEEDLCHKTMDEARALGRVEGRAEALEEIAALHNQIASLAAQVEDLLLLQEKRTKELMTTVYKELKSEFRRQTTALTPKEVMDICKPCLRRVAEAQGPQSQVLFRNASFMTRTPSEETKMPPPIEIPIEIPTVIPRVIPASPASPASPVAKRSVVNRISVSATEKIGTGRSAHMVYVLELRSGDTNGIRDNFKFNPIFIEKRKRALQLWINHLAWHYVTGYSAEMQMFLDGSDLVHIPRSPPFMFPRRRRTSSNEGSVRKLNSVDDKRLDRSLKSIQDKLPTLQRHLVKASKRVDGILKHHVEMSSTIELFGAATAHLGNFERLHGSATAWECLKPFALTNVQHWHSEVYELWDSSLQEMLHFQQTQVMPKFEKQVHDVSKEMQPSTVEKLSLEWDELQNIQARSALDSLLHVAIRMHDSHIQLQEIWQTAKEACMAVETSAPSSSTHYQAYNPPPPSSFTPPEPPRHEVFEHPTLDRPLKPNLFVNTLDPDADDAKNLFGCSPANPDTVFSAYQSSDEEEEEVETSQDPFSASWDSYIDRLRKKQKKQAKAEAAAVDEAKRKEKEAEATEIRKNRKRPQSMQWPLKRMARSHQSSSKSFGHDDFVSIPKSNSNPSLGILSIFYLLNMMKIVNEFQATTPLPQQSTETPENATNDNWIEAKTETGQTYYYHRISRATRWTKPDQAVMDDIEERLAAQEEATQRRLEERRKWYENNKRQQEWEASQIESFKGQVNDQVREWARNKDVVMMLRSLHDIIPSILLKPGQTFEVDSPVNVSSVKKAYMKAVRQIHPDKLPKTDFDLKDRVLAQHLFSTLTLAHDEYQRTHTVPSS
ncbi:hypothetical protein THRCLA_04062 [Thraustotheca clavata]|uniref:WW domain-containing protein n=1 Tax=Thraustotheca clavata TaxID=74557 RepID=A0A1W0A039_9STRA|nr:hypothetical protein THRCLA_04062 [Thraustotheca clavata]